MKVTALSVCALFLTVAGATAQDAAKKDVEALQGTWQLVSGEYSREKISPKEAELIRLIFKGETLTMEIGKEVLTSTYVLQPAKKPKAIDLKSTDAQTRGQTYLGIYELDGDSLKIW